MNISAGEARPSFTDALCTTCGLCCNGTLFADVELAGKNEAASLEILGLDIEDPDGEHRGLLLLPCRALKGTRCSIYPHRPGCCRTFECRLLQQVQRGEIGLEPARRTVAEALRQIAEVQSLLLSLGHHEGHLPLKERCAEALAMPERGMPGSELRKRDELEAAMTALEDFILETFLKSR